MTKMKHKWEWIRDACIANGYDCAAIVADQINTLLLEIYGDIHAEDWKRDYPISFNEPAEEYDIIDIDNNSADYCIACDIHNDCKQCIFGRRTGYCDDDSLFDEFWNEMKKVDRDE